MEPEPNPRLWTDQSGAEPKCTKPIKGAFFVTKPSLKTFPQLSSSTLSSKHRCYSHQTPPANLLNPGSNLSLPLPSHSWTYYHELFLIQRNPAKPSLCKLNPNRPRRLSHSLTSYGFTRWPHARASSLSISASLSLFSDLIPGKQWNILNALWG